MLCLVNILAMKTDRFALGHVLANLEFPDSSLMIAECLRSAYLL